MVGLVVGATACGGASGTVTAAGSPRRAEGGAAGSTGTRPAGGSHLSIAQLRRAAEDTNAVSSGRFEMTVRMAGPPGEGTITMRTTGAFSGDRSQLATTTEMTGVAAEELAGSPFGSMLDSETVVIGGDSYLRGGMLAAMFAGRDADPTAWLKLTGDAAVGALDDPTSMSIPRDALGDLLDGAIGEVAVLGDEDVRGTTTTHYRVMLDADAIAGKEATAMAAEALDSLDAAPMDIWVDGDGYARRMTFGFDIDGGGMLMTLESFDLGAADIRIEPPASFTEVDPSEMFGGLGDVFGEALGADGSGD